jgi:hypothetical protein
MYVQPFGTVYGKLVYFFCFGMFRPRKIWQPWFQQMWLLGKKALRRKMTFFCCFGKYENII